MGEFILGILILLVAFLTRKDEQDHESKMNRYKDAWYEDDNTRDYWK